MGGHWSIDITEWQIIQSIKLVPSQVVWLCLWRDVDVLQYELAAARTAELSVLAAPPLQVDLVHAGSQGERRVLVHSVKNLEQILLASGMNLSLISTVVF